METIDSVTWEIFLELSSGSRVFADRREDEHGARLCAETWAEEITNRPEGITKTFSGSVVFHRHVAAVGVTRSTGVKGERYI